MDARFIITEIESKRSSFLFEDNQLVKAQPLDNRSLIGNIYTAKVVNVVPSIKAAFVDVGLDDYLYYSLIDNEGHHIFLKHGNTDKVCIGDELLVQVSIDPIKTKKGVATSNITIRGDYLILNRSGEIGASRKIKDENLKNTRKEMIKDILTKSEMAEEGMGAILRTSAESTDVSEIMNELDRLLIEYNQIRKSAENSIVRKCLYKPNDSLYDDLNWIILCDKYSSFKIITDIPEVYQDLKDKKYDKYLEFFEDDLTTLDKVYGVEDKLLKGFHRTIYLKAGGSIIVEPTEALTVIDVNSGKNIKGKDVQKTFLKTNIEASKEIARIIRLRNLSGIIIIDFINLKNVDDIRELIAALKEELLKDEIKVNYVDMTPLGLVELTRKKYEKPLSVEDFYPSKETK